MRGKIRIIQVFKTTRAVIIEVPSVHLAYLQHANGEDLPIPPFDDPRWEVRSELQNEEVEVVQ